MKRPNLYLSKSLFIRGLQCHKSLYLDRYSPELRDEVSDGQERAFQFGYDVGYLAWNLFPGGVEIPHEGSYDEKIQKTKETMSRTGIIYEGSFSHDAVFIKADILLKGARGWALYEVKASTQVKEVHLNDSAIQYYVINGSGIPVSSVRLVHINNEYIRKGDIEPNKLFVTEDITKVVKERQPVIKEQLRMMRESLKGDTPNIDIGPHCSDPYGCDFQGHCWSNVPEHSVFDLCGSRKKLFKLYRDGILRLEDVPPGALSGNQKLVHEAFMGKKETCNTERIATFLKSLWYPLYFLDFETFSVPVPPFDGTWPYQHIPYQYSLHSFAYEGADLDHQEFLSGPNVDPRKELAEKLISEIPKKACILAFNSSYEARILRELADAFPQYRSAIKGLIKNLRDLAIPFRRKDIYHWQTIGYLFTEGSLTRIRYRPELR